MPVLTLPLFRRNSHLVLRHDSMIGSTWPCSARAWGRPVSSSLHTSGEERRSSQSWPLFTSTSTHLWVSLAHSLAPWHRHSALPWTSRPDPTNESHHEDLFPQSLRDS